jgi:hypothetical protein
MNMKNTQLALLLTVAFASVGAPAQQSHEGIAQLKSVKGNVLLSRQAGLAAGGEATRITEKTRVITTANSEVVVVYDNGCEVRLKENQRFEVEDNKPCAALIAQVQSILVQPASISLAGAGGAAGFWQVVPAIGGALIGVEILRPSPTPPQTPLSPS